MKMVILVVMVILVLFISAGVLNSPLYAQRWESQFQYRQYRVHSQVPVQNIAAGIKNLDSLKQALGNELQIELSDQPIELHIFSTQKNYRSYVGPRVPEAVNRPAVFVKGPDALWVYVVYHRNWEIDLRHEMTHAHLHACLPYLPIWLDEGLAKYFEVPDSKQGFNKTLHQNLVWRLRFRRGIRSAELEKLNSLEEVRPEHYRDSWAWVYYFLHSSLENRRFFQKYLQEIQAEEVPGAFFENLSRFSPDYKRQVIHFYRNLKSRN